MRQTTIGFAPAQLRRITALAEEAFEIEVLCEYLVGLDETLRRAADPHELRDIGFRALEALVSKRETRAAAAA